jgi:hypothetical protein
MARAEQHAWFFPESGVPPTLHHAATSLASRLSVIHPSPHDGVPTAQTGQKKFNSRLVAPTLQHRKPLD